MASLNWLNTHKRLVLVLVFGLFIYTFQLGSLPPSVSNDESVVGLNAQALLETGRDEYGQSFPIYFKFFGSYTPGLFVYAQTIPIELLGLNAFSIRILSVISMLIVAAVIGVQLGPLAALLFIITPWSVLNARMGYETTFAFALISLGALFYRRPLVSFALISLSTYAGHTQRYLAPLLIILIYIIFYRTKKLVAPLILAGVIQLPNLILVFTPAFWVKNSSFTSQFFSQYISYFSPRNLFYLPDYHLQRSIPELSVFYAWMFIPWLAGIYLIYRNIKRPLAQYLLGLILLSPLPAALANTNYSTQRALPLLLPYSLIIIYGCKYLLKKLPHAFKLFLPFLLVTFSVVYLIRGYFILLPKERLQAWDYGYQQMAEFIKSNPDKHFVLDNARSVPYSLLLFYLQPPMRKYQLDNSQTGINYYFDTTFDGVKRIGNTEVRPIIWEKDVYLPQVLISDPLGISLDQAKEHFLTKIYEVSGNREQIFLQAYETNPQMKIKSLLVNSE